jgi:hypothetical protein
MSAVTSLRRYILVIYDPKSMIKYFHTVYHDKLREERDAMGLLGSLLGFDQQKNKKSSYEQGLLDALEGKNWDYKKLKDKKYEEGWYEGLHRDHGDCDRDRD